jgi:hypothetical protein
MPRLRREEYTVGWVCALPVELAAAQEMLDEEHEDLERDIDDNDENLYSLGSIAGHNVAIVCPAGRAHRQQSCSGRGDADEGDVQWNSLWADGRHRRRSA